MTAARLRPFGASVFSTMTALAIEHRAINLAQGFPDFDGPDELLDAAAAAMGAGHNQYARSAGHPRLAGAIADRVAHDYGLQYEALTEVAVTSGATEGIAAAMLGLLEPGDEVVLFEPFYDSYPAAVAMAGGIVRPCTLRFPDFALDEAELAKCFTPRTRAVLLNTPHNPTGKVFSLGELTAIARLCEAHDAFVVSDEVYEHLTYDGVAHVPIATLPGMRDRTLTLSSLGKTYSLTGWKTGWATGPAHLVAGLQAAHQFLTFCSATPFQQAAAVALDSLRDDFVRTLKAEYTERRDLLVAALRDVGFAVAVPQGTYFVLADFRQVWQGGDDHAFARHLTTNVGVACIPPSVFYAADVGEGRRLARFAFCKRMGTLEAAAGRLKAGLGSRTEGGHGDPPLQEGDRREGER